jgi:CRP/FNR family transcriptional regulator
LPPLTRIQLVVYLQKVDLFSHCNAEQMVRMAGIARQRSFEAGERIYSVNDPAEALYCVVEGEVGLGAPGGESHRAVGPGDTFGVREILSDRLRRYDAAARERTKTVVLEAEDFFDLLSNNIEIVKALFRQLLREPHEQERPHASSYEPLEAATA